MDVIKYNMSRDSFQFDFCVLTALVIQASLNLLNLHHFNLSTPEHSSPPSTCLREVFIYFPHQLISQSSYLPLGRLLGLQKEVELEEQVPSISYLTPLWPNVHNYRPTYDLSDCLINDFLHISASTTTLQQLFVSQ